MALFEWGPKFCIGIQSIDDQHKKLVDYVNQLHEGMLSGKGADLMGPILQGLVEYTVNHFKYEEGIFSTHGYADAVAHKAEHDKLIQQVGDFHGKFKAGSATISTELMNFLKNWLMAHILGSDKKYVPFLTEKGVK